MKFKNLLINREMLFSLGIEEQSGRYFLAIPVSNTLTDYDEYYEIDLLAFERYSSNPASAENFLSRCRNREVDDLLILKPGSDRGWPW